MISYQDTLPLPKISRNLPTLRQVREQCGMSHVELATIAGVRPLTEYCMESGRAVAVEDAESILLALSLLTKRAYGLANVQGICLKPTKKRTR